MTPRSAERPPCQGLGRVASSDRQHPQLQFQVDRARAGVATTTASCSGAFGIRLCPALPLTASPSQLASRAVGENSIDPRWSRQKRMKSSRYVKTRPVGGRLAGGKRPGLAAVSPEASVLLQLQFLKIVRHFCAAADSSATRWSALGRCLHSQVGDQVLPPTIAFSIRKSANWK